MDRRTATPTKNRRVGPNTRKWIKFHMQYAAPTTYRKDFVWDRSKFAEGPFCSDPDGNVILDFISHVGSSPLGYNHPEIMQLVDSMKWTDPDRYAGCDFVAAYGDKPSSKYPTPSHLHHKVRQITKQLGFNQHFFTNSGAEAVENAIKICYAKRHNYGYGFSFNDAFHGRTLGVLSLNRSKIVQRKHYPQVPKVQTFEYCTCKGRCACGWTIIGKDGKPISQMREALSKSMGVIDPKEVAYIIFEPVQGEGGYNFPHQDFVEEIFEIANEHNIPVIADEVQSGMGKTGKWWAIENFKQKPDVMATAKAMRVGATMSSDKIFPQEDGRLSSTFGEGNAMASAVAFKTIDIIQKQNLLKNTQRQGRYFIKRLSELQNKFRFLSNARGFGLMDAIDVDNPKRRSTIIKEAMKNGLLIEGTGYRSIRFLPPLNVTKREIDLAMGSLYQACKVSR